MSIIFIIIILIILFLLFSIYPEITRSKYFDEIKILLQLNKSKKILDFGSGDCKCVKYFSNYDITPIDITSNKDCENLIVYDGKKIPFPDNHFDTTLCTFVLHHCKNQIELLDEIIRVTKNNIIILEDMVEESSCIPLANSITASHFHAFKQTCSMMDFIHTNEEWKKIFKNKNLEILHNKQISQSLFYPVAHRIYNLKIKN